MSSASQLDTCFTLVSCLAYSSTLKTFLWNACWRSTDYMALYPRRHNSSRQLMFQKNISHPPSGSRSKPCKSQHEASSKKSWRLGHYKVKVK
jgi:hypothetical protein